jgi:hypothetical protein
VALPSRHGKTRSPPNIAFSPAKRCPKLIKQAGSSDQCLLKVLPNQDILWRSNFEKMIKISPRQRFFFLCLSQRERPVRQDMDLWHAVPCPMKHSKAERRQDTGGIRVLFRTRRNKATVAKKTPVPGRWQLGDSCEMYGTKWRA